MKVNGNDPAYPRVRSEGTEFNTTSPVASIWSEGGMPIRLEIASRILAAMHAAPVELPVPCVATALSRADELIAAHNVTSERKEGGGG